MKKILTILAFGFLCTLVNAQDFVQWRGANRDGIYNESGLLKQWPEAGPELLWHFDDLGDGHASATVTEKTIYTAGMIGDKGFVYALDHSGKLLWKTEYATEWSENWNGVRSTPLLYKNKLYIMSAFGKLFCLNSKDGKIVWTVDLFKDYDGINIKWGVTENILIDDNKLYCTPGGKTANVVALDPSNGKLIWKSAGFGEESAYCSPMIIKLSNRKILVTHTARSIIGVDASDGKSLWQFEHINKYAVHPNTPIYSDGYLYCLSGYGKGGVMLKLSDDGNSVTEVWKNAKLDNQMGGVILLNGKIYGSGQASRTWICLDWKTGNEIYSEKIAGNGNIIFADGMLYCYGDNGEVVLVQPTDTGFKKISSFKVPFGANQHWAHLVIKDKKLYVRHGTSLMVYSIAAK
ncbi:MAG: PQQ-binding-like beta-propeller repeat protein [Tenuifilaceae bacterium]